MADCGAAIRNHFIPIPVVLRKLTIEYLDNRLVELGNHNSLLSFTVPLALAFLNGSQVVCHRLIRRYRGWFPEGLEMTTAELVPFSPTLSGNRL